MLSPAVLPRAGGGLRGGSWEIGGSRLVLHDYQAVTGVTVNGGGGRALTLRVAGPKAARGTVTLRTRGRLTGRLGGRRISVRLSAPRASMALAPVAVACDRRLSRATTRGGGRDAGSGARAVGGGRGARDVFRTVDPTAVSIARP